MWLNGWFADAGGNRLVNARIAPPLRIRWEISCRESPIASDGKRLVLKTPWELTGRNLLDGKHLWTFQGKRREIDGSSISATTEAIFIHSKGQFRSLGWDGQVQWERRTPKGAEEPGASCIAHGRHWGVRRLLLDAHNGAVLRDFEDPDRLVFFEAFVRNLIWYKAHPNYKGAPPPELPFEIVGLDPVSYDEPMRIEFRARTNGALVFTSDYIVCKVYESNGRAGIWAWSSLDGRSLCRIPIPADEYFSVKGSHIFCFVPPDPNLSERRLECHDLISGSLVWANDLEGSYSFPILTDGHVWFMIEDKIRKRSILVAVDSLTGKTVWQKPLPSYCSLTAAGDCILLSSRGKVYCLESVVSASETSEKPLRIGLEPNTPRIALSQIKRARACVKLKPTGEYLLTGCAMLLLKPARKPKAITCKPNDGSEVVLAEGLDGSNRYMSAFDAIEAEETAAIGLKVPDGARLILLRKGTQQTTDIDELTCIEVLLNAQGTHVACALITTDGEVGEATLRVYEMDTGKVAHEVALEPDSLLAMNLRWVDESHIAFRNEEAGDEEEWYLWDLGSGEVDAVE